MELNFDRDVRIDETALDVECLQQPRLMLRYGRASADAYKSVELAKEKLEVVRAELDEEIRSNPDKFNLNKVTDAVVSNAIVRDERYQEASRAFIQAKFESNLSRTAASAIDARKDMLETLVRLHGQQYFAGPSVPRDLNMEMAKKRAQAKSNKAVSAGMKRGK